jgi:glycosyltransferase 2 family protein
MTAVVAGTPVGWTSRTWWAWARPLAGAGVLTALVWRLGTGPFLDGLRMVDAESLAAAAGIAGVTTVCSARRWTLVARCLGVDLRLAPAVTAYYRSQFLNTVLPGGVLGDLHRGVRHGRDVDDVSLGLRAVVWERGAGQVVQALLAGIVLLVLPSPVRPSMPVVTVVVAGVGLFGAVLLGRAPDPSGTSVWFRALGTAAADLRHGLLSRRVWPGIVLMSAVVVCGHTAMFVIAVRSTGSTVSLARVLPLALLVLLAMVIPTSLGGWGPREGAAAWAFAAAGLGATQGVAVAVVYGVMTLVATLPGAVVLLVVWLHRPASPTASSGERCGVSTAALGERAARG